MAAPRLTELADSIRDAALASGADEAESFLRRTVSLRLEVQDGKVAGVRRGQEVSAALRVLVNGCPGFSYATNPGKESVKGMVEDAVQAARLVPPAEDNRFSTAVTPGEAEGILDRDGLDLSLEEKIRMTVSQEEAALATDPRITKVHRPSFSQLFRTTAIASGGLVWSYDDSVFSMATQAIAEQGGQSQTGYEWAVKRRLRDLDPVGIARHAAQESAGLLGGQPPETGTYPVLLPPRAAIDILGVLITSFSADEMHKGRSRLAGREGEKVFSDLFTLVEDGSRKGGTGTAPFDDERVPPAPRKLVDRGVVAGKLHTLKTAARSGEEPTGNGSRGAVSAPPAAATTNLYVEPSGQSVEPHLRSVRAVSITNMMGIHTADRISGDFSVGASGFILEGGERVRPFRNGTVSGNLFTLLADIAAVGDDLKFYGSVGAPSLLVGHAVVTGN